MFQAEGAESEKDLELEKEVSGKTRTYGSCLTLEEIKDRYLQDVQRGEGRKV